MNNWSMADTNSKYRMDHKDELIHTVRLATDRISVSYLNQEELAFACESNSYLV